MLQESRRKRQGLREVPSQEGRKEIAWVGDGDRLADCAGVILVRGDHAMRSSELHAYARPLHYPKLPSPPRTGTRIEGEVSKRFGRPADSARPAPASALRAYKAVSSPRPCALTNPVPCGGRTRPPVDG